ncbi:MAG: YobA family protein [Bacillus sp. (in: Bacteria)]|nr:YobA family protein [Bacillus sp. (in: firmicutes)]
MKRLLILLLLIVTMVACNNSEITTEDLDADSHGVQEGYIMEKTDSRILVVSDISKEQAVELTEDDLLGPSPPAGNAVWYAVEEIEAYEIGQLVRVQSSYMLESYPGQSTAEKVQIIE